MNKKSSSTNRLKPPFAQLNIRNPFYGQIWNTKRAKESHSRFNLPGSAKESFQNNKSKAKQQSLSPSNVKDDNKQRLYSSLLNLDSLSKQTENIENRPTSIYRHNDREFLHSLRNFNEHAITFRTTSLARYMKMSREIVDDFVRMKTDEFEQNIKVNPIVAKMSSSLNMNKPFKKNVTSSTKKRIIRPKSALASRRKSITNGVTSKSITKLNRPESYSDEEAGQEHNYYNEINDDEGLKPLFHRSMGKISSIANWERQIRYELEIEKELQKRELERQREKLQNDQRKLEDWDKQLRIELDARERKLRLGEEELKSRLEEFNQKTNELMRREQMINEIVNERIKAEMKFEIEKLRKKFNELEIDKSNLIKKEERVKEVEARLHEQVKIVKEKIDSKRMSEIELAKYRKELEITKKENEVLKEKVDSMEDYQIAKFENRAFKNELQVLKESLDSKNQELERDRERWEREQRSSDQKIMSLKRELRKTEQELVLLKQKSQADQEEITSKYEAANGQVKRLQAFIKDHLAKLNNDYSVTTQTLNQFRQSSSFSGISNNHHQQINHHRGHSLYHVPTSSYHRSSYHQRSVSMDGFNKSIRRSSLVRGCRLCNDDENEDDYNNNKYRNGINRDHRITDCILHDDDEEDIDERLSPCSILDKNEQLKEQLLNKSVESENCQEQQKSVNSSDEFVGKIVDQIYEKMSHKVPEVPQIDNEISDSSIRNDQYLNKSSFPADEQIYSNTKNGLNLTQMNGANNEKSMMNRFESSLNFDDQTPDVHRTLFEELFIASELETSKSKNMNSVNTLVPHNSPNLDTQTIPNKSHQNLSVTFESNLQSFPSKLQTNDTNNNRINDGDQKQKKEQNTITTNGTSIGNVVTKNYLNSSSDSNHSSKSSESFKIDW